VFNQIELERQAVELREFLIYHTDPALGAVWSRYEAEFKRLAKKHDEEIKQEVVAERKRKWQRQQRIDRLQNDALILGAVSGAVVVAVLLMLFVCLVIPLMAMLYFDTLTLQKKTEKTEARIEKLVKDLEKKEKQ
jgi:hypothetical protein